MSIMEATLDGSRPMPGDHVGMEADGRFIVHVEDGQVRLEPVEAAVRRVQEKARRYMRGDGRSPADELIEERRRGARIE